MMKKALSADFFARNTLNVAKELLGKHLVCRDEARGDFIVCKITETEAYTEDDPACHAFKGAKGRGATLFKKPGIAYVYFIYGMYYCFNVVTEPEHHAGAVLFRSLEPVYTPTGLEMNTRGPGRLCKALGITKELHNEIDLTDENGVLYIAEGDTVEDENIVKTARIGISVATDYPWRFYIFNNPWISVKPSIKKKQRVKLKQK